MKLCLNKLSIGILILLVFSVLAVFLQDYHWLFSLIVHFREWFLLLCIFVLFWLPWLRFYRITASVLALSIFVFHLLAVYPYWGLGSFSGVKPQENLNVFYANLNSQNNQKERLIKYLKEKRPDLVMLVEFNSKWANKIKSLESIYPYTKAIIREGNFGMAVLSKTSLEVENVYLDKENIIPALFLKSKMLNLVLLHAHPPIGKYATIIRDQYLISISKAINDLSGPVLLCGDFNTTPWTSLYKKVLDNSGLNYAKNFRAPNTWPTALFLPSLPIDHCLTKGIDFLTYQKGPDIGSDHWPLVLDLGLND